MILDYLQNKILIKDDNSELNQINKSQIKMAWGFKKQNNIYSLSDNCQDVFPKLIDYFTNNKIDYSLTDSSKNFLNQLDEANESFY